METRGKQQAAHIQNIFAIIYLLNTESEIGIGIAIIRRVNKRTSDQYIIFSVVIPRNIRGRYLLDGLLITKSAEQKRNARSSDQPNIERCKTRNSPAKNDCINDGYQRNDQPNRQRSV